MQARKSASQFSNFNQLHTQASEMIRTPALLQSLSKQELLTHVLSGPEADLAYEQGAQAAPSIQAKLQSEWQDIRAKLDAEGLRRQAEMATAKASIAKLEATVHMALVFRARPLLFQIDSSTGQSQLLVTQVHDLSSLQANEDGFSTDENVTAVIQLRGNGSTVQGLLDNDQVSNAPNALLSVTGVQNAQSGTVSLDANAYLGVNSFALNANLKSSRYKNNSCLRKQYGDYRAKRHSILCANESVWSQVA